MTESGTCSSSSWLAAASPRSLCEHAQRILLGNVRVRRVYSGSTPAYMSGQDKECLLTVRQHSQAEAD